MFPPQPHEANFLTVRCHHNRIVFAAGRGGNMSASPDADNCLRSPSPTTLPAMCVLFVAGQRGLRGCRSHTCMCLPTALARPTPVPSEPRPPADCAPAPLSQLHRLCMQPLNGNLPPLRPVESRSRNPTHMLRATRYLRNTDDQRLGTLGAASFRPRTARQPGPAGPRQA